MSYKTFNHVVIVGRLGTNPERINTTNGTDVITFPVSNDVRSGERTETQWHTIKVFGKQAVTCEKFLKSGDLCCIEGHIDLHTYEKDGVKRKMQTIIAEHVVFFSPRRTDVSTNETMEAVNDTQTDLEPETEVVAAFES